MFAEKPSINVALHYLLLLLLFLLIAPNIAFAHGGGLDSLGCHHNRKQGGYHCHRGVLAGQNFATKAEALQALKGTSSAEEKSEYRTVIRVVDGDTIVLDGNEKVRLIGVDTPETKHPGKPVEYFGKEASAFTRRMVERKSVRLEYDWERKDRYGRTLAYVYLEDGTFLNAEIIRQGYGHAYTRYSFKYLEDFRGYEREAREHQRGLWEGQ